MTRAGTGKANLSDSKNKFQRMKFSINPREDWKQIYKDALENGARLFL